MGFGTVITATASAMIWMFSNFVTASEFTTFATDIYYANYYQLLDRIRDAEADENTDLIAEYEIRLEQLRAKICSNDPEWQRCKTGAK